MMQALNLKLGGFRNETPCADHTGREFPSVSAMCRAWGIPPAHYHSRRRRVVMTVCITVGKGLCSFRSARAGVEVCSRIFTVCRFVKIFAVGALYSVAVCMLVR